MADNTMDAATEPAQPQPSLVKRLLLPLTVALVMTGGTLAALQVFGVISFGPAPAPAAPAEGAEGTAEGEVADVAPSPESAGKPAFFFSFYPDMLVNFTADGQPHYLKLSLDVMSRNEDVIKGVEEYHAIMRNNLLILFQQVQFETVKSQEGIASMQALALEEIKRVLKQYHGENDVEGVYFTSFVVQ